MHACIFFTYQHAYPVRQARWAQGQQPPCPCLSQAGARGGWSEGFEWGHPAYTHTNNKHARMHTHTHTIMAYMLVGIVDTAGTVGTKTHI